MRLFFAIELSVAVAESLHQAGGPLRALEPELGWAAADKLHLTMKFLGDVDDEGAARLIEAADDVARRHRPFEMTLGGVGAFPNFRRARVVWMEVESEPKLEWLQPDLEVAGQAGGVDVDGAPVLWHTT